MSDALPLPPRPDLEHYKKRAKDLLHSDAGHNWTRFKETRKPPLKLADAQFFVAHEHGFASWPKFASHVRALATNTPVSNFEAAADAIVDGDCDKLSRLLAEANGLVYTRSTRAHRSTLLHYVSANGIEDFRQKTPPNIVEIATRLLDAGADVNAESDAYGGGSTTLLLTSTSVHPEKAGVQLELIDLLIARGARLDTPRLVNDCLRNGRGLAAEFLAAKGAPLDFEGAAGVGRLDLVRTLFDDDNTSAPFNWACEFGRVEVVDYLLSRHVALAEGLHWAAYSGHLEIVRKLLDQGASRNTKDPRFQATPLGWAKHAAESEGRPRDEIIALLSASPRFGQSEP